MSERRILIIAGPNGAGKTSFSRAFLPEEARCPRFINADLIAAGLSPFEPEAAAVRAGRVMPEEIDGCIARGESFAFETTLARPCLLAAHRGVARGRLAYHLVLPGSTRCRSGDRPRRRPGAAGRP